MPSLISQAEFAKLCGVSQVSIHKAVKTGKVAAFGSGTSKKIHFDHEMTKAYLAKKTALKNAPNFDLGESANIDVPENSQKHQNLPDFSENGDNFEIPKTNNHQKISLSEQKLQEEIKKIVADRRLKELKYKTNRGLLIEKDKLGVILFKYLDALNTNMLDYPEMVIDNLIDLVKSGTGRGDLIIEMKKHIESQIKSTKKQVMDRLK